MSSNPIYIGYTFEISPLQPASEILIAELGELGFESFVETETGVEAFIQKEFWNEKILEDVFILGSEEFEIIYSNKEIEQINWNEEWEKNFNPIVVDDVCSVRAPFHDKPETTYDIVIEPKMSFGTGHHETTHMMIQHILRNDFEGKKVLDMGCGTGVLAILAEMRGATTIDAIDIDNWCYLNTLENIERNECKHISAFEGDVALLEDKSYDIVIANINRNILLRDIPLYVNTLNDEGKLFVSGFYIEDLDMITEVCKQNSLSFSLHFEENKWISACYILKI